MLLVLNATEFSNPSDSFPFQLARVGVLSPSDSSSMGGGGSLALDFDFLLAAMLGFGTYCRSILEWQGIKC